MIKRVLIAPLDWGLGHTARCIPIIKELLKQQHEVIFAGTQKQFDFVSQHQIKLKHVELFSYNVSYSKRLPQWIKIGSQINKFKAKVKAEHQWLDNFLSKEKIDVVISDNRYGLYSKHVRSIFIGHQLSIKSPFLQKKINTIHANYINKFNECWVPDDAKLNLSGELSVNSKITIPIKQIGILSRFDNIDSNKKKEFDIILLLSGMEPQRSILEQKLIEQFSLTNYTIALVRGTNSKPKQTINNIKTFYLLDSDELQQLIEASETIVCRSGYSSIMDLVHFTKKIIFIPTPGQTEQEYIAKHLKNKFGIHYIEQNKLDNLVQLINTKQLIPFNSVPTKKLEINL